MCFGRQFLLHGGNGEERVISGFQNGVTTLLVQLLKFGLFGFAGGFLHHFLKQLTVTAIGFKGLLPGADAHTFAGFAIHQRKRHLAVVFIDEIAFAKGATG